MMDKEDLTPEEFFHKCKNQDFQEVLIDYGCERIAHHYPTPKWINRPQEDLVVVVPFWPTGSPPRAAFATPLKRNPHWAELWELRDSAKLFLPGLASYLFLEVDQSQCSLNDYAQTFGLTATVDQILRLESWCIHSLQLRMATHRQMNGLELDVDAAEDSVKGEDSESEQDKDEHRPLPTELKRRRSQE